MLIRRITVATAIGVKTVIRSTKVSDSDNYRGSRNAPSDILDTAELKAGAADLAALEENLRQSSGGLTVACLFEVAVPARAAHLVTGIGGRVESGACRPPLGLRWGRRGSEVVVVV